MTTEELWPNGPRFIQNTGAFRIGTDAVLLADFAFTGNVSRAIDLGCGAGIIAIIMAWRNPGLFVDGLELLPDWADVARENVCLNKLEERVRIINGDLRNHRDILQAGAYDLVVTNPPYFPAGSGKLPKDNHAAAARSEQSCTFADVCVSARYLTRWGGRFALVHKPERLAEIICSLSENGLEPKRMRFVQHRVGQAPNLILLQSRRGANPSLVVEPPLILTDENGKDTDEARRIYNGNNSACC